VTGYCHVFLNLPGNVQHMAQSFIINNRDGVNFRQPVIGEIGEQHIILAQFLMPVRIMPDIDILTVGPAAVLTVFNQIKDFIVLGTGTSVTGLMNFRWALSVGDPESGFYHEASDGFLAKDQTMNYRH
jgi:hypothetical protein